MASAPHFSEKRKKTVQAYQKRKELLYDELWDQKRTLHVFTIKYFYITRISDFFIKLFDSSRTFYKSDF